MGRMMSGGGQDTVPLSPEKRAQTVRRVLGFFRPYRLAVSAVLVTIVITSLLGLVNPLLLKQLIDVAIPEQNFQLLILFVGLMIIVPIISGLIGVGQSYLNNVVGQRVMQDLRNALYTHLQKMPLRFFTETRTGEIQSRLSNDVGGIQSIVTDTASSTFSNIVTVISTVAAMILIDWRLTILSLATLPLFMWLTYRVGKVRRRLATQTQASLADITAITEETVSVSGMLLTKTFGQQAASVERYRAANAKLAALQIRQSMVGRWFFMIVGTVFSITPALVYFLAGYLAISGAPSAPTIGDIVAFTTLQSRLFFPSASCSTSRSRSRARWRCSIGSSSTWTCPWRSLTNRTRSSCRPTTFAATSAIATSSSTTAAATARDGHCRFERHGARTRRRRGRGRKRHDDFRGGDVGQRWRGDAHGRAARVWPRRHRLRGQAGAARRAGRAVRLGQDHDDISATAAVRRRRGRGRDRRQRRAQRDASHRLAT